MVDWFLVLIGVLIAIIVLLAFFVALFFLVHKIRSWLSSE